MGRLPEAWIAPRETHELRELVRYRAKLVAIRSGLKAQVHAVLAKAGVLIAVADLFGVTGRQRLAKVALGPAYAQRIRSLYAPGASARESHRHLSSSPIPTPLALKPSPHILSPHSGQRGSVMPRRM